MRLMSTWLQLNNMSDDKKKKQVVFSTADLPQGKLETLGMQKSETEDGLAYFIEEGKKEKKVIAPRLSLTEDPQQMQNFANIFKMKSHLIPDWIIKQIRIQDSLVACILRARGNTLSLHGHIRRDRFDVGIEVVIKPEFESVIRPEQLSKIQQRISKFETLLVNCGHTEGLDHDDRILLSEFLDIQARNALSFGRTGTEVVYSIDNKGNRKFHRFRPVDIGTIFKTVDDNTGTKGLRAETIDDIKQTLKKNKIEFDEKILDSFKEDTYAWAQVLNGRPDKAFTSDEMLVQTFYPSTDIEHNGYPVTPLDTCLSSVVSHISIDTYNRLYFQNGRAAKGMLVLQSEGVDQDMIDNVKAQFYASINSVSNSFRVPIFGIDKEDTITWEPMVSSTGDGEFQFLYDSVARNILSAFNISPDELPGQSHLSRGTNQKTLCLDLGTKILTKSGQKTLGQILGDLEEVTDSVWTGKKWEKARVFYSGERQRIKTKTNNGMEIISSPEHRFRVIGEDGLPCWKEQKNLTENDWVLINRKNATHSSELPSYKGQQIDEKMAEVLGWLTGDGNISVRKHKDTQNLKQGSLSFFYHHKKEKDLWKKHEKILSDFGIQVKSEEKTFTGEQTERRLVDCFAKTVSSVSIKNRVYDTDFVKFLLSIGFSSSTDGKTIPNFLYTAPESIKGAFLKGFFSADGTLAKNSSPRITIHNDTLRQQTKELLLSMGIRVQNSEGKFLSHPDPKKRGANGQFILTVKDKNVFFEKIGFLQDHKQPDPEDLSACKKWEKAPYSVAKRLIPQILESDSGVLKKCDKNNLMTVLSGVRTISADRLSRYMIQVGLSVPDYLTDFFMEKIVSIQDMGEIVEMADVEIFDDEHAFVANGMVVHNSESSNFFRLTAERDTGIRPLILKMQSFFNESLFPIIDPELSKICSIQFAGLDAQSKEEESLRLQQDSAIHMNIDEILGQVDKEPVGKRMGGDVLLNERAHIIWDKTIKVGDLKANLMASPAGSVDPMLNFYRDAFFFQHMQMLMQVNPEAVKAFYQSKKMDLDYLKLLTKDFLEDDGIEE